MKLLQSFEADLLILDALFMTRQHPTHICMDEAVAICRVLRPKRCLLLGMSGEVDYDEANEYLSGLREDLDIQLSHDGLNIAVVV
jgi:phosphoribosyl 1,2-cyclic phosphodiesterase